MKTLMILMLAASAFAQDESPRLALAKQTALTEYHGNGDTLIDVREQSDDTEWSRYVLSLACLQCDENYVYTILANDYGAIIVHFEKE